MGRPRLLAARHGPVESRWGGRCYGVTDALSSVDTNEAAKHIMAQVDEPIGVVHSSPLSRCAEPAARIADLLGVPHRIDERLRELDHGAFEGRLWDDIHREDPGALASWGEGWLTEGPPGGESALQVEARVRSWLGKVDEAGPDQCAGLLVAHAGVLRALAVIRSGAAWGAAMEAVHEHLALVSIR